MKSFIAASVALALASSAAAWDPPCNWENCLTTWNQSGCGSGSKWQCLCSDSSAIDQVNQCVVNSCDHWTDQEAIYAAVDQMCADQGITVTNSPEATFSMTSGGASIPTIRGNAGVWDQVMWDDWLASASAVVEGVPVSSVSGVACQPITGWSASWGPWSAAWTWTACSGTSPLPTTMTLTMTNSNGATTVTTTSTTLYVAAAASATATTGTGATVAAQSASATSTSSQNAAAPTQNVQLVAAGGAAAAIFGLMAVL